MENTVYEVDGEEVQIGKTTFCVAPLNLRSLKALMPRLNDKSKKSEEDNFNLMLEIILHSLRRNHKDITADELEDLLDASNVNAVVNTVLRVSGLEMTPGNVMAATEAQDSTSVGSTGN